jgi:predicted deacylase
MKTIQHPLKPGLPGTERHLVSLHFGTPGRGPKAYLQASLHADEWPAMLVAHHLREQLAALEAQGAIRGEVVLVPAANPIGLSQWVQGHAMGRFDTADGQNFNRGYPHLTAAAQARLAEKLGANPDQNLRVVRQALRDALAQQAISTETDGLKALLMALALDADIVLDLHCDNEGVMHLYTGSPLVEKGRLLAQLLGAQALLISRESGDHPFDEALSRPWWELAEATGAAIPLGCFSATVELRGQLDMSHAQAAQDARRLIEFLALQGVIDLPPFELPEALCEATPLEGAEPLHAPQGGIVVFHKALGDEIAAGEAVADVIDPVSGQIAQVRATWPGRLFARIGVRFATPGMQLAKTAGKTAFRTGKLLSE